MGILDEVANESQQPNQSVPTSQPSAPQAAAPQAAQGPSLLDQVATESQPRPQQPTAADIQAQKDQAATDKRAADAKHGLLHRAWDWVNSPIGDNVLPDGMKTSDIIRAAAFEKMYGQAYIPGINDFDTKAEEHFTPEKAKMGKKTEANGQTHPFVASPETNAIRNGLKTFIAGTAKDTSDMAASFTSPLALGTLSLGELGKVPGAVGKIARTVSPLVGTAFGLQGAGQAAIGGYHMATEGATPENVQETLGGAGQAVLGATAPLHTATDLYRSAESRVRPVTKTIAGQDVPVRPTGALPEAVAKSVSPDVIKAAAEKTATAVQHGVGEVTKGAVGSEAETNVGDRDRFGIRAHADDLKQKAVPAFKELDRLSEGVFSDAQQDEKNSRLDFSTEGREKFNNARDMQNYIMEEHRDALAKSGYDVAEMKENYRKQSALNDIADKLDTATNAREGGGYQLNGSKMANVIDRLRREPAADNLFDKAGMMSDHVNALADLADTLRNEQKIPKVGSLSKLVAKGVAVALSGGHGISGLVEGLMGESAAEKIGSKTMTKMFGEAMQSEPAARQLTQAIKSGDPNALGKLDSFKKFARQLWMSERGEVGAPGTVPDSTDEEQVAAHNTNGGSTFDTQGNNLSGANKYSVGSYPERTAQVEGELTPEHIRRFKTLNADLLNQEGHGIGTWLDQDTGKHVLDVARLYDDRGEAVSAGKAANQKAIYHLGGTGEPVKPLQLHHYSNVSGLTETDPEFFGTGKSGPERNRAKESGFPKRTYFATEGYKEPAIQGQKYKYRSEIDPSKLYNIDDDKDGLWQKGWQNGGATAAEIAVKNAGYSGYYSPEQGNAAAIFNKHPVEQVPDLDSKEITTRRPTSVKASMENNPNQHANMDAINQAGLNSPSRTTQNGNPVMGYKEKLARTVAADPYTGVNYSPEDLENPDKVLSKFVNHAASNLEWLYNQVPESIRQQTRRWYDSAHEVTKSMARQYGFSHEQAAGVTAALSPQNPWDNNIGLAKRMMDIYRNRQNFDFSPDMEKKAADLKKVPTQSKAFKGLLKDIDGKKLKDVVNSNPDVQAVQRALWIRLYDEAHGSPINDQYAPTGEVTGHSPDSRSWIGLDHAGKAVKILENDSVNNINDVMGQGHKIRNFYNNIINPNSKNGHVTIDTHATAAAQMQPFGAKDIETAHTFGNSTPGVPGPPKDAATGLAGTYPLYAEAYQRVAKKLGILPRELQSVTWEAIKSLMGDEKKTPELKAKAKEIWQQVQEGGLTPEHARDRIKDESQGFSKPAWMSDAEWDKISEESGDTSFNPEGEGTENRVPRMETTVSGYRSEPGTVREGLDGKIDVLTDVPISSLKMPEGNRIRPADVETYKKDIASGKGVDYPVVIRGFVDNGNHRIEALKQSGVKTARVWVRRVGPGGGGYEYE
jgi:hypothetical protein